MFYEDKPEKALRFGDVVRGFILSAPRVDSPSSAHLPHEYNIEVSSPNFAAIMSPCCSIGEKTLALSPLIKVLPGFFQNPYLKEDLTNVNRPMTPEQSVPPDVWKTFSQAEKQRRLNLSKPKSHAFVSLFVYMLHDLIPAYTILSKHGNVETGYYMVDFRRIYRVECKRVQHAKDAPLEIKILQLSIQTRTELRGKIASYFSRVPEEDKV